MDIETIHKWFKDAKDHQRMWRVEAKQCYDFVAGTQLSEEEIRELRAQLRPDIVFNRIQPMVAAVVGHQVNNRQEVKYLPREIGDVQVNELLTGAAQWVDDECDAEDETSEVFWDLVVTGMGWSETRISYDEDIDGKIHSAERIDPLQMFWDPTSQRRNLKDAKYVIRAKWVARKDAKIQWPKIKEIDDDGESPIDDEVDEPHDATKAFLYEQDANQWYNKHKDQVLILQTQWYEHKPVYRVGDPQTGRIVELSENKFNKVKSRLDENGIKYVRQLKKVYYQMFSCGETVLDEGENACPYDFTLRSVTGKRDASKGFWFGLVRGMIDPQKWANKFFSDIQDIMVSNRQGGAFVEETALVDPRQAEEIWNDPNPLILVRDGAISRGAIQERNPIPYPTGLDRMLEWAVNSLPAVTGINLEMMGFANRDQPNVLEMQRKRSALTVLADLFDSMRRFNKERGRVVLHFIQTYINDGRLIRIVGQNGKEQFVPLALDPMQTKFDVIVDEAATSPNQKEETFAVLMQLLPGLLKAGIMPPPSMLDYLPLPSSLVADWKKQLSPEEKPPDPMQQLTLQELQAKVEKLSADTDKSRAQAQQVAVDTESQMLENEAVKMGVIHPLDLKGRT